MTNQENKSFKIYVFGNPILKEDSLPVKLLPLLRDSFPHIQFKHLDPTDEFPIQDHLILLDTIINTDKIILLNENDIDKFQLSPQISLHDYDLAFQLKLMKKLGKIKKVTIIGLPPNMKEEQVLAELKEIISSLN